MNPKLAIVVQITNWNPHWDKNPFFVCLELNASNGLRKKSAVDCSQFRAISHSRFIGKIGNVSKEEFTLIKKSVALILDIDPEDCE